MNQMKKNLFVLLLWGLLSLIIAVIGTLVIFLRIVNTSQSEYMIFISCILSFILLGYLYANLKQTKGLLNGLFVAIFMLIVLSLIYFLGFEYPMNGAIIMKYLILLLSSGLGGVFGVNIKPLVK